MFSRAGRTRTHIGFLHSFGTNLEVVSNGLKPATLCRDFGSAWIVFVLPASIEEDQPSCDRRKRKEELARYRKDQCNQKKSRDCGLNQRPGGSDHAQGEDCDNQEEKVLAIIVRPAVLAQ